MRRFLILTILAVFTLVLPLSNGQADTLLFTGHLSGPNENPSNASPGTGFVEVVFDTAAHTLHIDATWSALVAGTTVAHIHCCVDPPGTVGVAVTPGTLPGFPAGVTAGSYIVDLDLTLGSTYTGAFVTASGGTIGAAEANLLDALQDGRAYFNIHSSTFPAGEIRDFLTPIATPLPGTLALFATGLASVVVALRTRRR